MARPREFDEQHAVERAMHAFWETGYEGTSTEQLCAATGLGRSSIYNTFTSKHALFRRSLRHYSQTAHQRQLELIEGAGPLRSKVRALLSRLIEEELEHGRRGCLAVNTVVELGGRDAEISTDLRRDFDQLIDAWRAAIERAQREGELGRDADPLALAQFVHSTVGGLRLMARSGADRAALENVLEVALTAL
ncbi:TetR/AcrR family transcriptional regulator [Amycolatopsis cihanbeyliensis]|uniref:TetR family transcriptional regulator n=1 Tax=Amycolatopsis cihanbeyliensis TaxID=1128664 RepID=A0A542DCI9_AMYCI|nr:TetR/AcrR family transcriptional regulator [Amycolatopsis cihanbeyliensis]TQJ00773.1 TetR family transcriptional regulator [Amycolatopsis cihanbeyliensis]